MTTDLIEKLKDNVDIDLVANFDYLDFVKYSFIPLCIKNNYYYIATDDKKFNSEGEQFVRNILGLDAKYKFIALSSNILNNLIILSYVLTTVNLAIDVFSTSKYLAGNRSYKRRRQWHPTPVLLTGKFHGRRSLVGCSPWGRQESDMTE